jgi:NAD+ kinase
MKKKIIILGDKRKGVVAQTVESVIGALREKAEVVKIDLDMTENLECIEADYVFTFGGDGSILSTARRLGANQIPVVGVNLGTFGFLAEFSVDEFRENLGRILAGDVKVRERMLLDCAIVEDAKAVFSHYLLNDVVVSRSSPARMVFCNLSIDGDNVTEFGGDGVIIATPSGSTAHSLAAGGPVLEPSLEAFIVTPLCPHSLTNRPLVVPAKSVIRLSARAAGGDVVVSFDGQLTHKLTATQAVQVKKAERKFKIVDVGTRGYYQTLREKLHWGGYLSGGRG